MSVTDNFRAERIALCGRAIDSASPAGRWWLGLAPLTKPERAVVMAEVRKRRVVLDLEAFAYERSLDTGGRIHLTRADLVERGVDAARLLEAGWRADPESDLLHPGPDALPRIHAAAAERQRGEVGRSVVVALDEAHPLLERLRAEEP